MNATTPRKQRPEGPSPGSGTGTRVHLRFLEFTEPKARAVHVAGSFNGWQPEASPMTCIGNGCWVKELELFPGRYEYRIIVDGQWIPDLFAEEFAPNSLGGINSVLIVSPPRRIEIRRHAGPRPFEAS